MSQEYIKQLEEQNEELKQSLAKAQMYTLRWQKISPKIFELGVGPYSIARVEEMGGISWVAMMVSKGFNNGTHGFSEHLTCQDAMMDVQNKITSSIT